MEKEGIEIEENYQPSQGGLIENKHSFETTEETIEKISVSQIKPFTIIPDYVDPTDSKYPFVVRTSSSTICIDGWNLVELAIADGKSTVTCKIEYIADHSDDEIARTNMSGYTDNAIFQHRVLKEGTNYIQKHFTIEGLVRQVREILEKDARTVV